MQQEKSNNLISKLMKQFFKLFLFCALAATLFVMPANAQQTTVTGTVVDSQNAPVPGAFILLKGTSNGSMTDENGAYSISVPSSQSVLVFSSIGYESQEITVGSRAVVNVVLKDENSVLDEVVVVAYGTAKKSDLTGALSTIKPNDGDNALNSVSALLDGKVAGLVVGQTSSTVGSASSVVIRGANSLRGDNQPLYVIDNIPQASTGEFSGSGISGDFQIQQDPLSQLNPADIVDITVLKDASSTAIYGSRGANGVILITTRKGREGNARVRVGANFTVAEPGKLLDMISLADYVDYRNSRIADPTLHQFHKVGNQIRYVFSDAVSKYDPGDPSTYHVIQQRNWQKEIYRTAFSHSYNVSVDGGSDKMTYYVSANFKKIDGTVKNTSLMQGDLRANMSAKLSRKTKLELMLSGSIRQNDMMAGGNTLGGATGAVSRTALDYAPFEMPSGDPNFTDENKTTVLSWLNDYVDKTLNKNFSGSLNFTWDIIDGLKYNLRAGGNIVDQDRKRWYGMQLYQGMNNKGLLSISDLSKNNYSVENLLTYNKDFKKDIHFDATVGVTYDAYKFLNQNTIGTEFTFFELKEKGLSKANHIEVPQPLQKDYQLLSFLARVNASFLDRYLITASFRADGSSKFAKGNRWGYFPSASFAWRIDNEPWMAEAKRTVSQLKARLSYGVTGNQAIDPYSTFSLYGQNASGDIIYADPNGGQLTTMIVTNLSNSGLKWEQTASWNLGIDFGFLKNRISGTLDLYQKNTKDLLISRTLPGSAGFASTYYNQGGMLNRGIELSLTAHLIDTKDWSWNLTGNIGLNRSKITDLGLLPTSFGCLGERVGFYGNSLGDHFGVSHIFLAGEQPGLFYGYQTQGIVQASDITDDGVRYTKADGTTGYYKEFNGTTPKAGDVKFVDCDGNGVVDENDRNIIGNPNPDFTYGFSTRVSWKGLALSASFNGVQGRDLINTNNRYINTPGIRATNLSSAAYAGMWTAKNASNTYPSSTFAVGNYMMDRYIEDASYLRCSDISLSWTLPSKWTDRIKFRNIAISASVKNAFVVTKYSGYDPEVNSFAFDGLRPGVDMSSYPSPRSFVFGLNLTF